MSPFQVFSNLQTESTHTLLYKNIYNAWKPVMMTKFKRHEDPRESSFLYINECSSLTVINFHSGPYGLSFYTIVGDTIMKSRRVEELLIDSTFKINKEKLELFTDIASFMGQDFQLRTSSSRLIQGMGLNIERSL